MKKTQSQSSAFSNFFLSLLILIASYLIAGTVTENRAAGEARAALPVQMMRMVSITHARPVLGARGLTIAFLLSTEMASSVNTELETLR